MYKKSNEKCPGIMFVFKLLPSIKKSYWRYLVKPEILLLVGAVQANLPYLFWRFGYPIPRAYRFDITYRPLFLWVLGYLAFYLGTKCASLSLYKKTQKPHNIIQFHINQVIFQSCILAFIFAGILQIVLACLLYGVVPILAYSSGYDVWTLNMSQEESGFGQLGLLRMTLYVLSGLILIGIISNIKEKTKNRIILWMAVIVVIFGSVFDGKTQGLFIFICFLLTGGASMGVNPINLFMRKLGLPQFSNRQMIVVTIGLVFFLVIVHGFTRFWRTGRHEEFGVRSSLDAVVAYLSTPLINTEGQLAISGLEGSEFEIRGLLIGLLPYKMQRHFSESVKTSVPRVEPTSPSGILAGPHWYLGLWGMLIFMFIIGAVCKYFYIKSRKSLFCLVAHSQIAWTLVAAHTYNHFLTLLFIPAPVIVFFVITKIVRSKQKGSNRQA